MKTRYLSPLVVGLLLAAAAPVRSDVSIRLGVGRPAPRQDYYRYDRWHYRQHAHRRGIVTPVVVAPAPYYGGYAYPVYVPSAPPAPAMPSLTGDYGTDLANLNAKLSRLRAVIRRQHEDGSIPQEKYDRFMNTLEGVEHDEHARAYDRGGNLSREDFADLYRRLDLAGEDIEIALAQ